MKKLVRFVVTICILFQMFSHGTYYSYGNVGTTYYVDASQGNDSHSGLSVNQPWKTLDKVNSISYGPGDRILFKRGSIWTGRLFIQGSGEAGAPIVIDQYGEGDTKPQFVGSEGITENIKIYNQDYIEINNLDLSANYTTQRVRRTVYVNNTDHGVMEHIYLKNLDIHDVHHNMAFTGNNSHKDTGGIYLNVLGTNTPSKFHDILIEGCTLKNVDREGIYLIESTWNGRYGLEGSRTWTPSTQVVVRNNALYNIQGDGIVIVNTKEALVERNYLNTYNMVNAADDPNEGICWNAGMWAYNADDTLFQYNECTGGISIRDGMSWDCDGLTDGTIYQYNYSYNNDGGSLLLCGYEEWYSRNSIYRYNISQNDRYNFITAFHHQNDQIYNNIFYTGSGSKADIMAVRSKSKLANIVFNNNIFYNAGQSAAGWQDGNTVTYDYNTYYGNYSQLPYDPHKMVTDPLFQAGGTGGTGLDSLAGYKLQDNSPCINTGKVIADSCQEDFYGNPINQGQPDRGVHEVQNPTVKTNIALGKTITASSNETNYLTPPKANDGDIATRWSSTYHDSEWITVDLGGVYTIDGVELLWEFAYGKDYKIQGSTNGTHWTDVKVVNHSDGGLDTLSFNAVDSRYVRMQGIQRGTQYGYSIYEFRIFEAQ